MANKVLQNADGDTSSKRISGFIGIGVALIMSAVAAIKDPGQITTLVWSWLSFSGVMFGVGVLEKRKEQ